MITGLTKEQIENLIEFIEMFFIDSIRNDPDVDNIDYLISMMDALVKLRNTLSIIKEGDSNSETTKGGGERAYRES